MKICLLCDDYLPHSTRVGAKMLHQLARELTLQDHKVTVITPWSIAESKPPIQEIIDGVEVWRFKSKPLKGLGKIRRAINESLIPFHSWQLIKRRVNADTFDGIIYYSPTIFFGPVVAKLKKLCNCRSYLVLRDFFPQWAVDANLIKKGSLVESYFKFFETISYRNADMIGVMSPRNLEIFNQKTSYRYNTSVLRNWASLRVNKVDGDSINIRETLGLTDEIIFFLWWQYWICARYEKLNAIG